MVVTAAATLVDPTGGVLVAIGSHVLTNMTEDASWRGAALDIWVEILTEEGSERRRQYKETTDEFKRHQMIWEWLQDELARVSDRVESLGSSQELKKVLAAVPDGSLAWDELCGQHVTSRPGAGSTGCKIGLGPHTARLIELVSPPPEADRGPARR